VTAPEKRPPAELLVYMSTLAGEPKPGHFFDIRWATRTGAMKRRFVSARRVQDAVRLVTRLAARNDVYVGVALREGRTYGGKSAIDGSHLLYIDCDDPHVGERLNRFAYSPSMIIASGSPGHLHIYWCLRERASSAEVENANRRLALALQGDPASVDIARILRPPETFNRQYDPPRPVKLLAHREDARYTLAEVIAGLPGPHFATRSDNARPRSGRRSALDQELLAIPPARYVRLLTDREPNRAGKLSCPFHRDLTPSLHLYADGSFYCFGCKRGGTIYDFAAARWGIGTRGGDFLELRRRLAATFGITPQPVGGP
jgi:RepB DNA-primase from phage plasmid/CHC2 zinc finger